MKNTVINLADHITVDKPYNKCIACQNLGVRCDGPNFLAMSGERWVEWCKLRKDYLSWSNQNLSDLSGISKPTVDRILSGHGGDIRNSTMEAITKALVNGTWGQFPCADPNAGSSADTTQGKENEMLRGEKDYLKRIVDDLQNSIKWYKDSLKWHKRIIVVLGILAVCFIALFVADALMPNVGWFRY